MSLLTEIKTSLEDNVQLQAVVSTMIDTMHEHPVYMMMSGSFREMDIYQKVHFIVMCNVHIDKEKKAKSYVQNSDLNGSDTDMEMGVVKKLPSHMDKQHLFGDMWIFLLKI